MLYRECLGCCEQAVQNEAVLGLEASSLGGGEAFVGELEARQLFERLADTIEFFFQSRA